MKLIVAVTKDFAIGKNNNLLFHLPSDLAYFKQQTLGKTVVMGEKTYLSLPKRPLPGRRNVVLSDNPNFVAEGADVVHSLSELFSFLKQFNSDDVMVCGGGSIYNLLMDFCDTALITMVDISVPADTFINDITKHGFVLQNESETKTENGLNFSFQTYKNKNPKKF